MMVAVVMWQDPDASIEDMPEYFSEVPAEVATGPPIRLELWHGAQRIAAAFAGPEDTAAEAPPPPSAARLSSRFLRLVALPGPRMGIVLEQWWATGAKNDSVIVDRRLRLELPRGDPARGWVVPGRIRRFCHWVPVVVELWPVYDKWLMMTMTPRGRVFASERYFRSGQKALDRLTAALAKTVQCTG